MITKKNVFARLTIRSGRKLFTLISLIICLILGACSSTSDVNLPVEDNHTKPSVPEAIPTESTLEFIPTAVSDKITPTPTPNRKERRVITVMPEIENPLVPRNSPPMVGETPEEILVQIFADLMQRAGVDDQNIQVIRSQAVTWNDGALGCPQPGLFYTQALVDGYWVVLQIDGVNYDYRVSDSGNFTLCKGRGAISKSPPYDLLPKD